MFEQVIAVDWSGQAPRSAARKNIWRCRILADEVVELACSKDRQETIEWLARERQSCQSLLVGLDFAFGYPAWFVQLHGGTAEAFWKQVAELGEAWLQQCEPPLWGRPGKRCLDDRERFRQADKSANTKAQPKSPFQIGGAGAVGTGSLRGIPFLPQLQLGGYSIWPFQRIHTHTVVEIYPRHFTGNAVKSKQANRASALEHNVHLAKIQCGAEHLHNAEKDDNAFDALLSAAAMWQHRSALNAEKVATPIQLLEGRIFAPPCDCVQPTR